MAYYRLKQNHITKRSVTLESVSFENKSYSHTCQRIFYFLILLSLTGCSGKKLFVRSGEARSGMFLTYCNDSLGVYAKFFGDFSQGEFTKKQLYKSDRYVLKKSGFDKKAEIGRAHV